MSVNAVLSTEHKAHVFVGANGYTQRATIDPDLDEIHILSVSGVAYCNCCSLK